MPRQSRGGAAPRRPTATPQKQTVSPPQPAPARQASTAATPPAAAAPPAAVAPPAQAASQGPGLFGQMASTAAGVAVGSTIGHALGGFFGGGSSAEAAPAQQTSPTEQTYENTTNMSSGVCNTEIGTFRKCMDQNEGSLTICGWYLEQLKACQQASSQY